MYDSNPIETYTYLLKKLAERSIAFVELVEPHEGEFSKKSHFKPGKEQIPNVAKQFRSVFPGIIITNSAYKADTAAKVIQEGNADLVSFGTLYINNPDLVERFRNNWPLNTDIDMSTWFAGGEKGYIDFPEYSPQQDAKTQKP